MNIFQKLARFEELREENQKLKMQIKNIRENDQTLHAIRMINDYSDQHGKNWLVYPARRHHFGHQMDCLEAVYVKRGRDSFCCQWIDPSITHKRSLGDSGRNLPDLEKVNNFIEHNFRERCPIYPDYIGWMKYGKD